MSHTKDIQKYILFKQIFDGSNEQTILSEQIKPF